MLAQHADPNSKNDEGQTALHKAVLVAAERKKNKRSASDYGLDSHGDHVDELLKGKADHSLQDKKGKIRWQARIVEGERFQIRHETYNGRNLSKKTLSLPGGSKLFKNAGRKTGHTLAPYMLIV